MVSKPRRLRRPPCRGRQARRREARRRRAKDCAIYIEKGASPRGHDHRGALGRDARHVHVVHRARWRRATPCTRPRSGSPRASIPFDGEEVAKLRGRAPRAPQLRGLARHLHLHDADAARERLPRARRRRRAGPTRSTRPCGSAGAPPSINRAVALRCGSTPDPRVSVEALRLHAAGRPRQGPGHRRAVGEDGRHLVRRGRLRPQDRQAAGRRR